MLMQAYIALRTFFEAGGIILWPIFGVTIVLWMLLLERYWYLYLIFPGRKDAIVKDWKQREDRTSWYAHRIREKTLSEVNMETRTMVPLIKSLVAIIPLLGLLGTVTGMIQVFEALSSLGSTNARAMAHGVSAAILPTMAAMTVAVFSLYFVYVVEKRIRESNEELEDELPHY
jgi:biopolymer transport protein ExbB